MTIQEMSTRLRPHQGTLLTLSTTLLSVFIVVIGFFLARTMERIDNNFEDTKQLIKQEQRARSDSDERLEMKIEQKINRNEVRDDIEEIRIDIRETRKDIKKLLER